MSARFKARRLCVALGLGTLCLAQGSVTSLAAKTDAPAKDAPSSPGNSGNEPAPSESPRAKSSESPAKSAPSSAELERLRAEYDRLREQLFRSRVRSQQVESSVYHARFEATLVWKGRPDFVLSKARVLLDGAEIWDSGDRTETDDKIQIAERPIKPGPHALTIKLEIRPHAEKKGGTKTGRDRLGYTSEHSFAITIPDNKKTHAVVTADEDGDPPEYEPEMELELENEP
jgi:hypothetical protein